MVINELGRRLRLFSDLNTIDITRKRNELRKQVRQLKKQNTEGNEGNSQESKLYEEDLKKLSMEIDHKTFSIEIPQRETMALCNYTQQWTFEVDGQILNPVEGLTNLALAGEAFELIDGDNLKFNSKILVEIFSVQMQSIIKHIRM